jgi:hypothetical protein
MTEKKNKKIIDGRIARWFDCDWNNFSPVQTGCGICKVCRYMDFLDYVNSVGKPEGSTVNYNRKLDEYIELKTVAEKQNWINSYIKDKSK